LVHFGFAMIDAAGFESLGVENEPFAMDPAQKGSLANRLMDGTRTCVSAFNSDFGDIRDAADGWMNLPLIAESPMGLFSGLFLVAFNRKGIR